MAHARTQIRNAVKAELLTIADFNGHVFTSRFSNLQQSELPSATVFCLQETNTPADIHDFSIERNLQLGISVKTAETADLDEVLDALCEQVEVTIEGAELFGGIVKNVQLTGTQIQINEDGAAPVGEALLQYQIIYFTQADNPAITL